MKLNLGCGSDIKSDMTNVNYFDTDGVDVVHDLNSFPYPFPSSSIDYILMDNVLEHLHSIDEVLRECSRILKVGGILNIIVPNSKFDSSCCHLHYFDEFSFDGFIYGKNTGMIGTQDRALFMQVGKIIVLRHINFRCKLLRRFGIKAGLTAASFKKYLDMDVNKDNTFGNEIELEFNLKKCG